MPATTPPTLSRRPLHLETLADLEAEVERIVAFDARDEVRTSGNWTAGQILQHLGRVMQCSYDGFPFTAPWHLRLACGILRRISWAFLLRIAFRPGHRVPSATLEPDSTIALPEAAAYLLGQLHRAGRGERMTQPSPYEGPLKHEQWVLVHLRHAELHLSFIHYRLQESESA